MTCFQHHVTSLIDSTDTSPTMTVMMAPAASEVRDDHHHQEPHTRPSLLTRLLAHIWDGPRPPHEAKLIQRLDLHLMTYATYGYFVRLLDSSNITNAYISGMSEDLSFHGNQFNLLGTFFTCGYLVGQIPSQLLMTRVRPSIWLPTVELGWSILTFAFSGVKNVETVFALRFLVGLLESGFAVGVITVMGSWYTKRELGKRIAIFYSASYAAQMFSGYLQAGIYRGMEGHLGWPGWRWLFIFCGVISLPGAAWGYYAVPDSPYTTRVRWLREEQRVWFRERAEGMKRARPVRLSVLKGKKILGGWKIWVFTLTLIFHCVATQPLNYFPIWLKALKRFSVYQLNVYPTGGQALGLVTTLAYGWVSDYTGKRWQVLLVPATINFVGIVIVAVYPSYGWVFAGYMLNGASWGFWPVLYAWVNEVCGSDAEERAVVIAVAQTMGQAFVAWVPVVVLNVGKYAPKFTLGFRVLVGISVGQWLSIWVIRWFVNRGERTADKGIEPEIADGVPCAEVGSGSVDDGARRVVEEKVVLRGAPLT